MKIINRRGDEVIHIHIKTEEDGYAVEGGETFASLSELIDVYSTGLDELREKNGNVIRLIRPVNCTNPTNERYGAKFLENLDSRLGNVSLRTALQSDDRN